MACNVIHVARVLQCVAVCCSVLQCVAACNVIHFARVTIVATCTVRYMRHSICVACNVIHVARVTIQATCTVYHSMCCQYCISQYMSPGGSFDLFTVTCMTVQAMWTVTRVTYVCHTLLCMAACIVTRVTVHAVHMYVIHCCVCTLLCMAMCAVTRVTILATCTVRYMLVVMSYTALQATRVRFSHTMNIKSVGTYIHYEYQICRNLYIYVYQRECVSVCVTYD